jgi:phosphoglycerate-specific signal transduction histidine kinase
MTVAVKSLCGEVKELRTTVAELRAQLTTLQENVATAWVDLKGAMDNAVEVMAKAAHPVQTVTVPPTEPAEPAHTEPAPAEPEDVKTKTYVAGIRADIIKYLSNLESIAKMPARTDISSVVVGLKKYTDRQVRQAVNFANACKVLGVDYATNEVWIRNTRYARAYVMALAIKKSKAVKDETVKACMEMLQNQGFKETE